MRATGKYKAVVEINWDFEATQEEWDNIYNNVVTKKQLKKFILDDLVFEMTDDGDSTTITVTEEENTLELKEDA